MGFRFRRSVKLIPGMRLNISTGGASLSLGRPGATLNFSKRGARATFGLPGTGLSWSQSLSGNLQRPSGRERQVVQPGAPINTIDELESVMGDPRSSVVYSRSGRRLSPQQIEALRQRLLNKQRREAASAQLTATEGKQKDILNAWRNTSDLPTAEEYQDACSIRPFNFEEVPPQPWDEATEQSRFKDQIRLETTRSNREPPSHVLLIIAVPTVAMLATLGISSVVTQDAILKACALIISTGLAALITRRVLSSRWKRHISSLVDLNFGSSWPQRKLELDEEHSKAVATYGARKREAEKEWLIAEQERSAWAKRLVDGDIEALEEAITDTVGDLDFPFEAKCDVAILEDRSVCLHLDLPEIEDVIPETRGQVLKDGRVRQVKRTTTERNSDYAHLVTGLALYLANEVFVVSPTLYTVKIAAYTQRKKRGTQEETDAYVYDVSLSREKVEGVDFAVVEPVSWLASTATAFEQQSNLALKALAKPSWTRDFADK